MLKESNPPTPPAFVSALVGLAYSPLGDDDMSIATSDPGPSSPLV